MRLPSGNSLETVNFSDPFTTIVEDQGIANFDYGAIVDHPGTWSTTPPAVATPEPSSLVLFGSGVFSLAAIVVRKKRPGVTRENKLPVGV